MVLSGRDSRKTSVNTDDSIAAVLGPRCQS
jgi:hypothetical protein